MVSTILFDYGNTLVGYYNHEQWPTLRGRAIAEVRDELRRLGRLTVPDESIWARVQEEDHESADHCVRLLEGRLTRIFQLDLEPQDALVLELCRAFLRPLLATAHLYEDTLPVLRELSARGHRMAIVSNTAWGSPAAPWREDMARVGVAVYMHTIITCLDVGWRKPARAIFQHALAQVGASVGECVFVGDDWRWDICGPRAIGMRAVLIERSTPVRHPDERPIRTLHELYSRL